MTLKSQPQTHFWKICQFYWNATQLKKGARKSFGPAGAQVVPYHEHRPATMVDPIFDYQFRDDGLVSRLCLLGDRSVTKHVNHL